MPRSSTLAVPWMACHSLRWRDRTGLGGGRSSFGKCRVCGARGTFTVSWRPVGFQIKCSGLWYEFESLAHGHESKPARGEDSTGGMRRPEPEGPTSKGRAGEVGPAASERNKRQRVQ